MLKLSPTKQITLSAMCVALTVLFLYAAAVLPTMQIACYFLSSVFVYVLCAEQAYLSAVLIYLASAGIGFMLLPNKTAIIPYVFLMGHYGIFKSFLDARISDRLVTSIIKILYCDAFFAIAVVLAVFVLKFDFTEIALPLPVWAAVLLLQAAFLAFDLLYFTCEKIYLTRIRSAVIPRR